MAKNPIFLFLIYLHFTRHYLSGDSKTNYPKKPLQIAKKVVSQNKLAMQISSAQRILVTLQFTKNLKQNYQMQAFYTVLLLILSNIFMTFAWYGHLKLQQTGVSSNWPLIAVILFSWGIALFEYCCQVPANRIGFIDNGGPFSLIQLKVIQEVVSLIVFTVIVTTMFRGESLHWNHIVAFCFLVAAVYFVFK